MGEFREPAVVVGTAESFLDASWRAVARRRKEWIRSLRAGDSVLVVDDYGTVYQTTVRFVAIGARIPKTSLEPMVFLAGHSPCYAAGRIYRRAEDVPRFAPKDSDD